MIKNILAVLLVSASMTSAATLSFSPVMQTINLGETTSVAVQVGDLELGKDIDQAIKAYQLRVLFDASILDATSVVFSDRLGAALSSATDTPAGAAEASFVSSESHSVLLGLQRSQPFTLFTINFTGIGVGTSLLSFALSPRDLSDQDGILIPPSAITAQTGSITVTGDGPVIPEPSTFLPLAMAAGVAWFVRRRHA